MILDIIYSVLIVFLVISLLFIFLILTQKTRHRRYLKRVDEARDYLFKKYIDKEEVQKPVSDKFFLDALINVDEQIKIKDVTELFLESLGVNMDELMAGASDLNFTCKAD